MCYISTVKLIIGIGNPGEEYDNTRHNVGFLAVDAIANKDKINFSFEKKFNAEITKARLNDKPVILAKPHTFVNKSGEAVKKIKLFYKAKLEDIIIVQDDLDIEFGNFKMSFGKDSGGHRGIDSVISFLKTNKFWRLRIGTANRKLTSARHQANLKSKKEAVGNFVLAKFTPNETKEIKKIIKQALVRLEETIR